MSTKTPPLDYLHTLNRYQFLTILNAAQNCEEYQFSKHAAMLWLVNYPGDLYVQYFQALTLKSLGHTAQAIALFRKLIEQDPLFLEPTQALSIISKKDEERKEYEAIVSYLQKENIKDRLKGHWLSPLLEAEDALSKGDLDRANNLIHQALLKNPNSPIPAVFHLRTAYQLKNQEMLNNLSAIYFQKWPKCLQINIIKAIAEMDLGQDSDAVERLHYVAAHDSAAQVITRLMGTHHRFVDLWPDRLEIYFDLPVPASVSAYLGWNQLGSGEVGKPEFKTKSQPQVKVNHTDQITQKIYVGHQSQPKDKTTKIPPSVINQTDVPEKKWATEKDFEEIQLAFSKLAKRLKKVDLERSDNRFPVYVIMTSKKQLEAIYGPNTTAIIDELLQKLAGLIRTLPEWSALLFYPDDPVQMSKLGLKPVTASDAWQAKLALADLDKSLAKQGEMIGALLIVGGPEIVPFHHLPNPTFDNDLDVPSDNPYATVDENYFIPQWPVGRLPGETGSDAGLLLSQIRRLIYQYQKRAKQAKSGLKDMGSLITWLMNLFMRLNRNVSNKNYLGYSAEIWQEASRGVYKTVGNANDLQLSPPIHSETLPLKNGNGHNIGYFNLHGVKDGPHWYGQKDFASDSHGPDYPIALSPAMFNEKVSSPKIVFSEACYGGNIVQKFNNDAISLKFMDSGTSTFIGSTCISYGSVTIPLIAADFLAEKFWQKMLEGQAAGYALMQAKLKLAEEMTRLQGFLDGEDQKTILSFVLYGDPLAVYDSMLALPKPLFRIKSHPPVRTISDSEMEPTYLNNQVSNEINQEVKKIVAKYLPGLDNAQMHMNKTFSGVTSKTIGKINDERYTVTLQKSIDQNQHTTHHHYARMTFNKKGKLVKFTTSR